MLVVEVKEVNHRDSLVLRVVMAVEELGVFILPRKVQLLLLMVFPELNLQVVAAAVLLVLVQVLVPEVVVQVAQVLLF
jgi:hypothetical protein